MLRVALTALAFILSPAFAYLAWKPWVPEAPALVRERGVAVEIVNLSGGEDKTTFRTDSGALAKLTCGRRKACGWSQMDALRKSGAAVPLAHYHGTVYEIDAPEHDLHVTLADAKAEWAFPTVLSVVLLGVGLWLLLVPAAKPARGNKKKRRRRGGGGDSGFDGDSGDGGSSDD